MDKRSYFIEALQAGLFGKKHWVMSAFAKCRRNLFVSPSKSYPYEIFLISKDSTELGFFDPEEEALVPIEGSSSDAPVLLFKDKITVTKADVPNVDSSVDTTYGNVLLNMILLVRPFGDKVGFLKGKLKDSDFNSIIEQRLTDDPLPGEPKYPDKIYVSEFLQYQEGMYYLSEFAGICAPGATAKSLSVDPRVIKRRDELLLEYKDQLDDVAILAKIMGELVELDKETLKDDPSSGYLIGAKSYAVTRMKLFIMYGREEGFGHGATVKTSLSDGMDLGNLPAFIDALRAGSYNRGAQTALGGVEVKRANQIFQSVRIIEEDCGFNSAGLPWLVTHVDEIIGRYIIDPKQTKPISVDRDNAKQYVGQLVELRTPMLCKTVEPHYCETCCGKYLSMVKDGVHVGIANMSSNLMYAFMGAMHGKALQTELYDINTAFT